MESSSSNLNVPAHSYHPSLASNASSSNPNFNPNFASARSQTGSRISRTNTNGTDVGTNGIKNAGSINDAQSLRTIDNLPSAKPSISYSDKLWTQIDVLDDVKNMAGEVRSKGSFFNDNFNEELKKLKQSQNKLLESLASQQFNNSTKKEHRKQLSRLTSVSASVGLEQNGAATNGANVEEKTKEEKTNEFFGNDDLGKYSQDILYRKQNFEEMNKFVTEIKDNLDKVGENMKRFDGTTREMW